MSHQLEKINGLIHHQLAEIIVKEVEFPENSLVTLTRVDTSKDLNKAFVYYSCYPDDAELKVAQTLSQQIGWLHHLLSQKLKIKKVPKLYFILAKQIDN